MSVSRIMRIVVALSSLSIAVQSPLRAQLFRGTITGTIVDASGAFVPDAQIQVEEQNTASIYKTVSNSEGRYTALSLAPGVYRVTVEKTGFKRHVGQGIQVSADEHVAVNVKLEVGNVIDSVVVTTEAPLIQTETGTVGQVFGMEQGDNVPLNGRTAIVLAWTAYGVSSPNSVSYQELRPYANAGAAGFSMGGAPLQTNDLQIDGGTNNTADLRVAYNPPEDAVAEVKVESLPVDAASGHTGGGSVNVITKSGTNTLHGSAYEFNRVSNLTANLFFNNLAGAPKQPTLYNQWGSSLGGPLMIPKVLDGRNRVFIFLAYEGIKERANTPVYSTVPTAAQRNGDFSGLLALGASYQIYDPLTGVVQGSRISRQPFPNNIIPASRFNPIAQAYLSRFYPLPNVAGTSNGLNNFYAAGDGSIAGFNNTIGRLDFNLSDRHKLFVSGRHNNYDGSGENLLGHPLSTTSSLAGGNRTNFGAMVDDVYTFSPTMVMDTRLNWTQYNQVVVNFSSGFDITSLGFPQALKNVAPQAILPNISFSTYRGVGAAGTGPTPYDAYQIFSTVSKQANQHSIKFGVDFRQTRSTALSAGNPSGTYTFGTSWTNGPLDNSSGAPIGQDMASFLLGLPTSGGLDINSRSTLRVGYYAGFIQDDYHVTPSLTLNLGLRYEKETPTTDVYDRSTKGFDMTAASPINAAAIAAYANNPISQVPASQFHVLGGLLFTGPGNRALYSTSSHSFAPRIGFAFSPPGMNHKLVVRGAVGIFYFPLGNTGNNLTGFNQNTPFNPTTNGYLTPAATLSNPFPNGILQPVGAANGLATYMGQSVSFYNPHPNEPYSIRTSLDIQRELTKSWVLQLGYIGNHSVHLAVNRSLNYIPPQYLSTSPFRDQTTINLLTSNVPNPLANLIPGTGLNGSTVALSQLLLAYPQFTGVTEQAMNDGSTYFNSLNVRLEKRYSHGWTFVANYAYSKLLDKTTRLNAFDPSPEKTIDAIDAPHRLVLTTGYELPFGKGQWIGTNAPAIVNHIVGGWIFNMILSAQSGAVLTWGNDIYLGGDLQYDPRNVHHTFNTAAFNTISSQQLADNIRTFPATFGNLRADGVFNFDMSMIKNFKIWERLRMQYRAEFFNAFNHTEFNGPNVSPTSSAFGTITGQANDSRQIQMALRLTW